MPGLPPLAAGVKVYNPQKPSPLPICLSPSNCRSNSDSPAERDQSTTLHISGESLVLIRPTWRCAQHPPGKSRGGGDGELVRIEGSGCSTETTYKRKPDNGEVRKLAVLRVGCGRPKKKKPVRETRSQTDFLGGGQRGEPSKSSPQIGDLRPLPDATGASAAGEMGR